MSKRRSVEKPTPRTGPLVPLSRDETAELEAFMYQEGLHIESQWFSAGPVEGANFDEEDEGEYDDGSYDRQLSAIEQAFAEQEKELWD